MLVNRHKRYIKKYRIGGSGIFDTLTRLITSNSAKAAAKTLARAAASDIGKTAISAGKTAAKELATAAISAAKDAVVEKGKQLISRALTPKNRDTLESLVNGGAIRIEDLVKRSNGGGLRLARFKKYSLYIKKWRHRRF